MSKNKITSSLAVEGESLGHLLAAEADFLNANGWTPCVMPDGEIQWKEPGNPRFYRRKLFQDEAVKQARKQIEKASALLNAGWTQNVDSHTGEETWTKSGNSMRYRRDQAYMLIND